MGDGALIALDATGAAERLALALKRPGFNSAEIAALSADAEHCCVSFSDEHPTGYRIGCCSRCTNGPIAAASKGQACVPLSTMASMQKPV